MSPSTSLLQRQYVAIATRGELVTAQFGNIGVSMEFQAAIELSLAMKLAAREAKRRDGNEARRFRTLGTLTDLNAAKPKPSRFGRGLPERLAAKQIRVKTEGTLVALTIGHTTIKIPYEGAATIAQWFRVRGKEARNAANERAHWSKLITVT